MSYIDCMRDTILAMDKLQAEIRLVTMDSSNELNSLYPLMSMYQQVSHVNINSLLNGVCTKEEYDEINESIKKRIRFYKSIVYEKGGQVK